LDVNAAVPGAEELRDVPGWLGDRKVKNVANGLH
jgi:hypothetical protein